MDQDKWGTQKDFMWTMTFDFATEAAACVPTSSGHVVVDVCAGSGTSAIPIALRASKEGNQVKVIATDISAGLLAELSSRAQALGVDQIIETRVEDAMNMLTIADASVDSAISVFGVPLVPDPAKAVKEIARILKPGGRVFMMWWMDVATLKMLEPLMQRLNGNVEMARSMKVKCRPVIFFDF